MDIWKKSARVILILVIILCPMNYLKPLVGNSVHPLEHTLISSRGLESLDFNATNAYNYIIKQLYFGFRVPGFQAHRDCAAWINQTLQNLMESVIVHNFTVQKTGQPLYECQNILGKINTNKSEIVILGAHWDSRAVAEKDSYNRTQPIPGANDGASGVAVLLELAHILNQSKDEINAQIWFLFIDAEDQGESRNVYGIEGWRWCEGAIAFTQDLTLFYDSPNEAINAFILLDMVGGTNLKFVDEAHSTNTLQNALFRVGRSLGYTTQFPSNPKLMTILDDHVYFIKKGIPSVNLIINFIDGPWTHHHKHSDNLENIDIESLNITGRTVESFVKSYYSTTELPNWGSAGNNDLWQEWIWPILLIVGIGVAFFLINKYAQRDRSRG